jgi:hypothetical protein
MFAPELTRVLVSGSLARDPFLHRELTIEPLHRGDFPADTRAIVFVAGDMAVDADRGALVGFGRRYIESALNAGISCIVAADAKQMHPAKQVLGASAGLGKVPVILNDPEKIAQRCLRLRPGPAPDQNLKIDYSGALEPDTEVLLRRAFSGFQSIALEDLPGGRSVTDGIWRVDAKSTDAELRSPFVVKCGPRKSIDMQVQTYRDIVADRVPFRGCAPLCIDRSVAGFSKRLSVSRFVERALRLDVVLMNPDCANPEKIIGHIFDGPLHRWRASPRRQSLKLLDQFLPNYLRRKYQPGLTALFRKLPPGTVRTPGQLFDLMKAVPRREVPICRAHDDLNFRNVFVADGGAEIILIDFTRSAVKPLSQDIARMDVGLAFDNELNEEQPIDDDVLEAYYARDLFSISLPHTVKGQGARARLAAIEALRHRILIEASAQHYEPNAEYKIAIIAGLLYEAKRRTKWSATAYRCADALVSTL